MGTSSRGRGRLVNLRGPWSGLGEPGLLMSPYGRCPDQLIIYVLINWFNSVEAAGLRAVLRGGGFSPPRSSGWCGGAFRGAERCEPGACRLSLSAGAGGLRRQAESLERAMYSRDVCVFVNVWVF